MRELDDVPIERSETTEPLGPGARRTSASPARGLAAGLVLAIVLGGAAWFWLRRERPSAPPAGSAPPAPAAEAAPGTGATEPLPPLPSLDASDALVRELGAGLSAHPRVAAWLAEDGLLRRYVAVVTTLVEGSSPAQQLPFLRPAGRFTARRSGGRWLADEASGERYDLATEVFLSLDGAAVARLHRRLSPLLEQAYREVGDPALSFDQALGRAVAPLLEVPLPGTPPELVPDGALYRYARPELEALTAAQKQLLRLGPANARRVQAKLAELAAALGLSGR